MQTAVEWLVDQMFKQGYFDGNKPLSITNLDHLQHQAMEMEKWQRMKFEIPELSDEEMIKKAEEMYNEFPHTSTGYISKGNCIAIALCMIGYYREQLKQKQ